MERAKEVTDAMYAEQGYLQREEVQWGLLGLGFVGAAAGVWCAGRRAAAALTQRIQWIVPEELQRSRARPGA